MARPGNGTPTPAETHQTVDGGLLAMFRQRFAFVQDTASLKVISRNPTVFLFTPRDAAKLSLCLIRGSPWREAGFTDRAWLWTRVLPPRSPEVSSTAFRTQPPDLQPAPLMDMGFAIIGPLARHRMPRIRFLYIGSCVLLHASFRPSVAGTPLRFAMTSPPSGCQGDFHLRAVEHARHTNRSARPREPRTCVAGFALVPGQDVTPSG